MLWNRNLETGVELVDEQHKELFRRVETLLNAGQQGRGKEEVKKTIEFLESYIVKHFNEEYELQVRSRYPKAALHKRYHDNYIQSLASLKQRYQAEGETLNIVLTVNRNVVGWLTDHINKHDQEFAQYYRSLEK